MTLKDRPVTVRDEDPRDHEEVFEIHRAAFGQEGEGKLVRSLQAGGYAVLSQVAEAEGKVVGHIFYSRLPIKTDADSIAALSLAPLAVAPAWQRQGIGSLLIERSLADRRGAGSSRVLPPLRFLGGTGQATSQPLRRRSLDGPRARQWLP
jgi:putative acetyltransferase